MPPIPVFRDAGGHYVEPGKTLGIDPRQLPCLGEDVFHLPGRPWPSRGGCRLEVGEIIGRVVEDGAGRIKDNRSECRVLPENRTQRRCDQSKAVVAVAIARRRKSSIWVWPAKLAATVSA